MKKMLIVDDDAHIRNLVKVYAELEGFECSEAEDADQALESVSGSDYDILILDIMMPGRDGYETLAGIRKHTLTLKNSQVVRNLLYNAINHTKDGQPVIVDITESGTECTVEIKMRGNKSRKMRESLYGKGTREASIREAAGKGPGLGFPLSVPFWKRMEYLMAWSFGRDDDILV